MSWDHAGKHPLGDRQSGKYLDSFHWPGPSMDPVYDQRAKEPEKYSLPHTASRAGNKQARPSSAVRSRSAGLAAVLTLPLLEPGWGSGMVPNYSHCEEPTCHLWAPRRLKIPEG